MKNDCSNPKLLCHSLIIGDFYDLREPGLSYTMQFFCNLSRNVVVRQAAGRLKRVTCPLCNLPCSFFVPAMITPSKLVLHDAIFLATCLAMLEREIHCKMQKTCYTLQSRAATCNLFKTNSMQSLQKVEPSFTLCSCYKPKKLRGKSQRGH